jgi:hypothetical protein
LSKPTKEDFMGLLGKALKIGALGKAVQVIQREAKKPENKKKINDALTALKNKRAGGGAHKPGA